MTQHKTKLILALLTLMVSACTNYQTGLSKEAVADSNQGYIYGRFTQKGGGNLQLGAVLKNQDTKAEHLIQMDDPEDSVKVIAVPAGKYAWEETVFTKGWMKVEHSRKPVKNVVMKRPFVVTANKAHYLGDFTGVTSVSHSGNYIYSNWNMKPPLDKYRETTEEFHVLYPNLKSMRTVNIARYDAKDDAERKAKAAALLKLLEQYYNKGEDK